MVVLEDQDGDSAGDSCGQGGRSFCRVLSLGVGLSGGIGSAMTVPLVRLGSRVHFPCSLRQELFSADLRLWVKLEA